MSISQIKRGVYTRVDSTGIESNKGTFFESIMAPVFEIEMTSAATTGATEVAVAHSFFSITGIVAYKIGVGGAADALTLNRIRGSATDAICTFAVATATAGGEVLLPNDDIDVTHMDFLPGDIIELDGVAAAGSPAAQVHLTCRID
jgi:hypothetical protein